MSVTTNFEIHGCEVIDSPANPDSSEYFDNEENAFVLTLMLRSV